MYVQGASDSIKATRYGHESNGFHVFGASKRRRISRDGLMRRLIYHEAQEVKPEGRRPIG